MKLGSNYTFTCKKQIVLNRRISRYLVDWGPKISQTSCNDDENIIMGNTWYIKSQCTLTPLGEEGFWKMGVCDWKDERILLEEKKTTCIYR